MSEINGMTGKLKMGVFGQNKETGGSFNPNLYVMEELVMKISCMK